MTRTHTPIFRRLAFFLLVIAAGNCHRAAAAPEPGAGQFVGGANRAAQDNRERLRRPGYWIRIHLPIDNSVFLQVKQTVHRTLGAAHDSQCVFVLEFVVPELAADAGQGTQFEDALKLANFLTGDDELNKAETVAYVPKPLKGHAVLAAMACQTIIMGENARIGQAGYHEKVTGTMLKAYEEIASRRLKVPPAIAQGMLDDTREVFKVDKVGGGVEFVGPDQVAELDNTHSLLSKEKINAWEITAAEACEWGIAKYKAKVPDDVVRQMELSSVRYEGGPAGDWRPIRVDIKDPIKPGQAAVTERLIEDELHKGANFVCLWIDSRGGSSLESDRLAKYLIDLPSDKVYTVAYIPREARADAAMIALACDEIIMHPGAVLGGEGHYQMKPDEVRGCKQAIRDSLALRKGRSWSLWAAMLDPHLDVYRCRRFNDEEYFGDEELKGRQPQRGEEGEHWEKHELVTTPGEVLEIKGEKAQEYGLATRVVENFAQFKQNYGLENDPALVEQGWVDHLAHFFDQPIMGWLLVFVGVLGIYIELHAPGMGVGAFIAVVAFALFFWSRCLEGTAGWLEVTLFVTGLICLLTEIFIFPGFVIFGVGGAILILTSVILASQTFFIPQNEYQSARLQYSLLALSGSVVSLVAAIMLLNRWLPRTPLLRHVFLAPPEGEEAELISRREMLVDLDNLVGQEGLTTTPLGPSGKARFGNHLVDVISTGDFISRDSRVLVTEVHGNRVVVRLASGEAGAM